VRQHIKGFYADRKRLVLHDMETGDQEVVTEEWDRNSGCSTRRAMSSASLPAPGEPEQLTEVPTGAAHLRWVGDHVYFVSNVWPGKNWDEMAERIEEEEDDPVSAKAWSDVPYSFWGEWLDAEREYHLFRIPGEGGEVEDITRPTGRELPRGLAAFEGRDQYDVSPDASVVSFVADSAGDLVSPDYDLFLVEPGSADVENITPYNEAPDRNPLFSPVGRRELRRGAARGDRRAERG
jgi:hypothetical protein